MATILWRGGAAAVAQVVNLTVGGQPLPGDLFSVTINGNAVSFTEGATATIADVVVGVQTALAASLTPEFQEATWTAASPAVAGTAVAPGSPFTASVNLTKANLAVPVQAATSGTTGGSLTNGTSYYYVVTATNSNGETTASNEQSYAATTLDPTAILTWAAVPGATGYKIYRSTSSGAYGASSLLHTVGSGATVTYNDTGTATGAGQPPGSNGALSTATFALTTPTASSGPNDVSVPGNWSTGSLPANGDSVYLTSSAVPLLWNLDALAAVTPALVQGDSTFTANVGLPRTNPNGYPEYRPQYLQFSGATAFNLVVGAGGGSQMLQFDFGAGQVAANVAAPGSPSVQGRPAVILKGTHAANTLNVTLGNVGSAIDPGEVSTWATVSSGYQSSPTTDVTLLLGAGCTLTTITQDGGQLTVQSNTTTHTVRGGAATILGAATVGTLDVENGTVYDQSTGTKTTVTVGPFGTIDARSNPQTKTYTNTTVNGGGTLLDPNKTITFTNPISVPDGVGGQFGANIDFGTNTHLQRS
jgi:hypothetical protein